MNFGFRNGRLRNNGNGECSSSFFYPLAVCTTSRIKAVYPSYHFVDNCSCQNGNDPGSLCVPYPWLNIFQGGCQCKCVHDSEYPDHRCDPFC